MRTLLAAASVVCVGLLGLAGSRQHDTCAVTIRLVDSTTGKEVPGLVRVSDGDGRTVPVDELLSRGLGLDGQLATGQDAAIHSWSVLPGTTTVQLPRTKLTVEAFWGLETERAIRRLDLSGSQTADVTIPLVRFYDARNRGYRSGNTHLHLMKISRGEADRYLTEIPQADGLDAVFLSYLERAVADRDYISNAYVRSDLTALSRQSGVLVANGEEHRHNFEGFGEGYGHVMLLNINELIQPVSIGQGIMKTGTDGIPLQRGIDTARRDGATVIWCHNEWGREDVPNLATGRLDAVNIFDGGIRSSYKDSYYRYLNAGWHVPFSTGTDWFMYDFSRVYVNMQGATTADAWLNALAAGKSFITNGPLLEFSVAGESIGSTVNLAASQRVSLEAFATGRVDFEQIEVVQNGRVRWTAPSRRVGDHYEAAISLEIEVDAPCWLALRTPPSALESDPELNVAVAKNEFGRSIFAHTSPVYVELAGRRHFDPAAAAALLAEMETHRSQIAEFGNFADDQERARVLDVYTSGIAALEEHARQMRTPQ